MFFDWVSRCMARNQFGLGQTTHEGVEIVSKPKKAHPHLGPSLDDLLETEGVRSEFELRAIQEVTGCRR